MNDLADEIGTVVSVSSDYTVDSLERPQWIVTAEVRETASSFQVFETIDR